MTDEDHFVDIANTEDPLLADLLDALALIWARLARIEAKVDDLNPGEDIG